MPFIKNVTIFTRKVPIQTGPLPEISIADNNAYVIKTTGRVFSWGAALGGALGNNQSATARSTPGSISGVVKTFCKITSGFYFASSLDKNGRAWSWGFNTSGQLGNNSTICQLTPVSVLGAAKTFCHIDSTGNAPSVVVIDKNGRAWGWGGNSGGQLGDNSTTGKCTPVSVRGVAKTFCQISTGGSFTSAIDKNGQVWAWGSNGNGQLGDNSTTQRLTPVSVCGVAKTFCQISNGSGHTIAIDKNGQVWAWGSNNFGQLGDSIGNPKSTPVLIYGTKTFCQISAGPNHSLGIDKNGRVWGWGLNSTGQLGDNSLTSRLTPVSVAGQVKTFCKISASDNASLGVDKNGKVWSWGANSNGKLGDNSTIQRNTPVAVCTL